MIKLSGIQKIRRLAAAGVISGWGVGGFIATSIPAFGQTCPSAGWIEVSTGLDGVPARNWTAMASDSVNGRVVLFGGAGPGILYGDTWVYDGATWSNEANTGPSPRTAHAMAYDPVRNRTVLFGGATDFGPSDELWEWDGTSWTQVLVSGPSARTGHSMGFDSVSGRVILFGGVQQSGVGANDTWAWNGTAWEQLPAFGPPATTGAGMASDLARQRIVLFGGVDPATFDIRDTTWEFDGTNWNFVQFFERPDGREYPGMAYDTSAGKVVLYGGIGGNPDQTRDTWIYDGSSWTQISMYDGPSDRVDLPLAYDSVNGRIIQLEPEPSRLWAWDDSTEAWSIVGPIVPQAANNHVMTYDSARNEVLRFGGDTFLGQVNNLLWSWNGTYWVLRNDGGPSPRYLPGFCFDSESGNAVLYGGTDGEITNDETWLWNGTNWSIAFVLGPTPRSGPAMAFDPIRGRTVLFGGLSADYDRLNDTWEFDGSEWTEVTTPTAPIGRDRAGMVFDPDLGRIVMFGGRDANYENSNELWQYDGTDWTLLSQSGPSGRGQFALAYDANAHRLVVHGGIDANYSVSGETWVWSTGDGWQRVGGAGPGLRSNNAMAYDASAQHIVMFGGFDDAKTVASTWTFGAAQTLAFTLQPLAQNLIQGDTLSLSAAATANAGTGEIAYRWVRDGKSLIDETTGWGSMISGATTGDLMVSNAQPEDYGYYYCIASNDCGSVITSTVFIYIDYPPYCPADFNDDGGVDGADVESFFIAFGDGIDQADVNQDGGVDGADVETFFLAWSTGGC